MITISILLTALTAFAKIDNQTVYLAGPQAQQVLKEATRTEFSRGQRYSHLLRSIRPDDRFAAYREGPRSGTFEVLEDFDQVDSEDKQLDPDGPLFYLTQLQEDWYRENSSDRYAVPPLEIALEQVIWTGKCDSRSLGERFESAKNNLETLQNNFVDDTLAKNIESYLTLGNPFESNHVGSVLGGTRPELGFDSNLKKIMTSKTQPLTERGELFFQRHKFKGDVVIFGKIAGVAPLSRKNVRFYDVTRVSRTVNDFNDAQSVLFGDGRFVVLFPCVPIDSIGAVPFMVELNPLEKRDYRIIKLGMVDPKLYPKLPSTEFSNFDFVVGLSPSTWNRHRELLRVRKDALNLIPTSFVDPNSSEYWSRHQSASQPTQFRPPQTQGNVVTPNGWHPASFCKELPPSICTSLPKPKR